jgi:RNA-binding protein
MPLSPAQRKTLKARAHALHPVVLIGGNGLSPGVLEEIDVSLRAHELIKVQVAGEDRDTRALMMEEICERLGAEAVQSIGRILVVYRRRPEADAAPTVRPSHLRRGRRQTKRSFQGSE